MRSKGLGWLLGAGLLVGAGCSPNETPSEGPPAEPASARASALLADLRQRFSLIPAAPLAPPTTPAGLPTPTLPGAAPLLGPGAAEGFRSEGAWLLPRLPDAATQGLSRHAEVRLPRRAHEAFELRDRESAMTASARLLGAREVEAEQAEGWLIYRDALGEGTAVLHRPIGEGTEDFVLLPQAPATPELHYRLDVRAASGLRLVGNTLELLDAGGAPRLRVAPPYLIDASGCVRRVRLAIEGCAVDTSEAEPWGRPVTAPGAETCGVVLSWGAGAVAGANACEAEPVQYPMLIDPAWTATGNMIEARHSHTATRLPSGRVLVVGGQRTSGGQTQFATSAELYDPGTGTWASAGGIGSLIAHAAELLKDGRVGVFGGYQNNGSQTAAVHNIYAYNPASGWQYLQGLAKARGYHTATVMADGRVVVVGGQGTAASAYLQDTEIFNPANNSISSGPVLSRQTHKASVLADGRLLVTGGYVCSQAQGGCVLSSAASLLDTGLSAWSNAAPMLRPRAYHRQHTLPSGQVVVALGTQSPVGSIFSLYDPSKNQWQDAAGSAGDDTSADSAQFPGGSILAALSTGSLLALTGTTTVLLGSAVPQYPSPQVLIPLDLWPRSRRSALCPSPFASAPS